MKRCPRCGSQNPDESAYCCKCGTPLSASPPDSSKKPSHLSLIAGVIFGVSLLSLISLSVLSYYMSPNEVLVTPSQVSAVLGGKWEVKMVGSTGFKILGLSIRDPVVIVLGTNYSVVQLVGGPTIQTLGAQGPTESLTGVINGSVYNVTFSLQYFNNSYDALVYFNMKGFTGMRCTLPQHQLSVVIISSHEFIKYYVSPFFHSYVSEVMVLNGSVIKEVQVFGPSKIPQNQLIRLASLF
ncbi:zinc ribbon domain-containing protein [Stygiolobus caldivivus]|uniref:Zinc ribbon domain-containing protein n=1 Tax=Stygiolobus caldivivus TaxID=2824673 RepID=A0A8D5U6H9_9CREN|nr:zinc ribbon domain-containing protein [Stygiolobus caldivivus]BCU69892.1 zinc ribbon domain-containing protein [Stygiolobus caldivivus]